MSRENNNADLFWALVLVVLVTMLFGALFRTLPAPRHTPAPAATAYPTYIPPPAPIYRPTPTPTPVLPFALYAPVIIGGAAYTTPELQ
jgi:hypothetical protein